MLHRRRALSVPATLVALRGGLLAPLLTASAADASATSVSGRDGVLYEGCHEYKYGYSIDTSGSYYTWDAEAIFRGPDGRKVTTDYLNPGADEVSGSSTALLCGGIDPVGRYELTLNVTFYDENYDETGTKSAVDRFRLRKPHTRTSFTVDDRTPRWHQILIFQVRSMIEGPKGYVPNRWEYVALETKRPDGWERIRGSKERVGRRGVTKMKGRWERRRPLAVRAVTLPGRAYDGSASGAKTLG